MIRNIFLLAILVIVLSCEKDKDYGTFTQEELNGTWQAIEKTSLDCTERLEIADTVLSEIKICTGIPVKFKAKNYSFNGQIIKYDLYGLNFEFQISGLTEDTLLLGVSEPKKYFRVE